jgi:hypothetical protein
MPNELTFLRNQAGIEATRGTDTPATRIVYADITMTPTRALGWGTQRTGTYNARRVPSYGRISVAGTGADVATYEDLPWWLLLGLKGGVTGVTDAGTPPAYTYTFVPSLTTDDLASITLEHNESDNPIQTTQTMVNSFTLRGDPDNNAEPSWMLDLEVLGRDWTSTTFTAALTDRTTEAITAAGTKIYMNDTAAALGTTQLLGTLINWSITVNNNLHFKAFAEDETSFAANRVGRGSRTVDAQFVFEFADSDELDNFLSTTPVERFVRLEREGSIIHDAITKRLRVDLNGYWSGFSRGDREGNLTATFTLQAGYNVTTATDLEIEVVNDLASLV